MYEYRVRRVVRVLDGDTFDCELALGFGVTATLRLRLFGADAPELFGAHAEPLGVAARDFSAAWLTARTGLLTVQTTKASSATVGIGDGVYGRWLASFLGDDGANLAVDLARAGFDKEHPLGK